MAIAHCYELPGDGYGVSVTGIFGTVGNEFLQATRQHGHVYICLRTIPAAEELPGAVGHLEELLKQTLTATATLTAEVKEAVPGAREVPVAQRVMITRTLSRMRENRTPSKTLWG